MVALVGRKCIIISPINIIFYSFVVNFFYSMKINLISFTLYDSQFEAFLSLWFLVEIPLYTICCTIVDIEVSFLVDTIHSKFTAFL